MTNALIFLAQMSGVYLRYLPFSLEITSDEKSLLLKRFLLWAAADSLITFFILSDGLTYRAFKIAMLVAVRFDFDVGDSRQSSATFFRFRNASFVVLYVAFGGGGRGRFDSRANVRRILVAATDDVSRVFRRAFQSRTKIFREPVAVEQTL